MGPIAVRTVDIGFHIAENLGKSDGAKSGGSKNTPSRVPVSICFCEFAKFQNQGAISNGVAAVQRA